jgi:hypothetical protein
MGATMMKTYHRLIVVSLVVLSLAFSSLASGQSYADEGEFKWESHEVIGSSRTPVGRLNWHLAWKEPHLLEGTVQHEITAFFLSMKPTCLCTWRFTEDFSKLWITAEVPMANKCELVRMDKAMTYEGVWETGFPMGKYEMSLIIYPDRIEGSGGGQELFLQIIPPLSPEEVPPGLRFIFEE